MDIIKKEKICFHDVIEKSFNLVFIYNLQGLPQFNNIENLVNVLTHFIYICSVEHSATNFPQYEQYAFPPNFAALLHGQPGQVKVKVYVVKFSLISFF